LSGRARALLASAVVAAAVLALGAPASAPATTTWLCEPGAAADRNPCVGDLTTTVVAADGRRSVHPARANPRAPIDCFYVYPTVSAASGANAPLALEPAVTNVARFQARPFSRACRVYAPLYRQITSAGWAAALGDPSVFRTAYRDVRGAWREYLRRHNRGRGVVLIGHSQGTAILRRLVHDEIDLRPRVRRRLVSALLIGGNVQVRRGRDAGGDFRRVRACRRRAQAGCVVAYSTFDAPPPPGAAFSRVGDAISRVIGLDGGKRLQVLCTNPAAPGSGREAPLRTLTTGSATAWVEYPGLYAARCRTQGDATWLNVRSAPSDPRAAAGFPVLSAARGLHLFDVNLALGDLVGLVRTQGATWLRRRDR
jgi:hypothetical protein